MWENQSKAPLGNIVFYLKKKNQKKKYLNKKNFQQKKFQCENLAIHIFHLTRVIITDLVENNICLVFTFSTQLSIVIHKWFITVGLELK